MTDYTVDPQLETQAENMIGKIVMGVVRHFLSGLVGAVITAGYMTHAQGTEVDGMLASVIPIGLSVWSKYQADQKLKAEQLKTLQAQAVANGARASQP